MEGQGVCTGVAGARVAKYCGLGHHRKAARKNVPVQRFGGQLQSCRAYLGWYPSLSYGCSTSQEVASSIPYIVLAQFRLELTKLSCLCLVNPLTNAHLPVPVPPGPRLFQRQGVWLRFSD